jgi:hypothetical protein
MKRCCVLFLVSACRSTVERDPAVSTGTVVSSSNNYTLISLSICFLASLSTFCSGDSLLLNLLRGPPQWEESKPFAILIADICPGCPIVFAGCYGRNDSDDLTPVFVFLHAILS